MGNKSPEKISTPPVSIIVEDLPIYFFSPFPTDLKFVEGIRGSKKDGFSVFKAIDKNDQIVAVKKIVLSWHLKKYSLLDDIVEQHKLVKNLNHGN